jgi:iron complex outermembrane receptor protein
MNKFQFQRRAVALASLLFIAQSQALAQEASQESVLESVVVTGTAEQAESITKPFSIITADELNANGASTLGEALRYQPGVSATGFGPNSSRPIVRGQDSDRIKILRNSAATVDVSALSFDHALPIDPFALHQVEILRGPAALAYGAMPWAVRSIWSINELPANRFKVFKAKSTCWAVVPPIKQLVDSNWMPA